MAINLPNKSLLFAGIAGVILFWAAGYYIAGDSDKDQIILSLEGQIQQLEEALAKKDENIKNLRMLALRQQGNVKLVAVGANSVTGICTNKNRVEKFNPVENIQASSETRLNGTEVLRDLGTRSANDPRSFSQKAADFLAGDTSQEKVAVVSKAIFDMVDNREILPDYMLQSMYGTQADPDLKRVIAQVLSSRGNNSLIDNQINEAQTFLRSDNPNERQVAITHLAKTRSTTAADAIVPLLNDSNIDVKLNALLALRTTGNQTHVAYVERLLSDPDPAVKSLAKDVVGDLRNLSDSARTILSLADIASELPATQIP
jgi:hypothetical protein